MIDVKRIFPECNADTLLIELLLERGKPAHYKGISKVAEAIKRIQNNNLPVVGIIDNDKFNYSPYIKEFIEKENKIETDGLLLKQLPGTQKFLIFISPAFERWIWKQAEESNIRPIRFGYNTITDLCGASKSNEIREDANFKKFVNKVVRSNCRSIQTLKEWLIQIID